MSKPNPVRETILQAVEWVYPRPEGDIVAYAVSAEKALEAMRGGGFLIPHPEQIRRGESRLTNHLKKEGIS